MAQPTVQSVEQIIADYAPAYTDSLAVLDKRRAAIPAQFQAQRMGLEAAKVQGFNQINNQATGRGMSFSGVPLNEQANYLSTQYLPGMQQLTFQENDANLALDSALAAINKERRLAAMDVRTQQQASLEKYLAEERQMAWEREKFNAEIALQRASLAARSSGGGGGSSGGGSSNDTLSLDEAIAMSFAKAGTRVNKNGKVVSGFNAAENTALTLSAAGYGSYADILNKAYGYRKSTFGEK